MMASNPNAAQRIFRIYILMKVLLIWMVNILPFKNANSFILNVYTKLKLIHVT